MKGYALFIVFDDDTVTETKATESTASDLIDDDTRRALFASLRDAYGAELLDEDRLRVVSILAGKDIHSMSRGGNMTMADAHRVLDILATIPK